MRIILGLAISVAFMLLAQPAALAQQAKPVQQASLPPEPQPILIPGAIGQGTLALTASAAVTYQEYFAHECPLALTVDAFGWTTHAALNGSGPCPENVSKISKQTIKGALNACEAYSHTPPCAVIAVGRKVVWDGTIRFIAGRMIPQGDHQRAVVLRKIVSDEAESISFETSVGQIAFAADGRSGDIVFQRHDELGQCRGSLTTPAAGEAAAVTLACTKAGAINGAVALDAASRTGKGTAKGAGWSFVLTVLPNADFMKNGDVVYAPPVKAEPKTDKANANKANANKAMTKQDKSGAS